MVVTGDGVMEREDEERRTRTSEKKNGQDHPRGELPPCDGQEWFTSPIVSMVPYLPLYLLALSLVRVEYS